MRNENEIRENLEWLRSQCANFKDNEADVVIRQLETLFWVVGHERQEAQTLAQAVWDETRSHRKQNPRNY